ncbi:uncharacterized protein LOC113312478 [Papaver somniferum]|uniref:uncharacterized protein LOC113312478 n=1 Tax=Papaver somniferum TaxID=3469 RepID=UPI000E6FC327|nr:uncharacterized protein LOC113312478 [Papaver somniferum]
MGLQTQVIIGNSGRSLKILGCFLMILGYLVDIRLLFNAILNPDERNVKGGGAANRNSSIAFVNKFSLIDLPMAGGRFTWTNSQQPPLLIRLDNFILNHPDSINNLRVWWDSLTFYGKPSFIFAKKLQGLKFFIKNWKKNTFGNLQAQIDNLELVIDVIDNLEIAQRAKERWVKEGEKNSAYLHQIENFKYKNNSINCLKIDGVLYFDKKQIAEESRSFYSYLFTESHKVRPGFDNLEVPYISELESIHLEIPFPEEGGGSFWS